MVAEMPGYPIRKLPFAGPETRTEAAMSTQLLPHQHGQSEGGVRVEAVDYTLSAVHQRQTSMQRTMTQ